MGENARILIENLTKHEHTTGSIKKHKGYMRKVEEIWESIIDMRIYDEKLKETVRKHARCWKN